MEKEYLVRVGNHESWSPDQLEFSLDLMRRGGMILPPDERQGLAKTTPLRPVQVKQINESQLQFVLTEGKHRQIRRMCALVGLQVLAIKRVRIGEYRLGGLPVGCWTSLSPKVAASVLLPRHPSAHINRSRRRKPPPLHWRSDRQLRSNEDRFAPIPEFEGDDGELYLEQSRVALRGMK